MTPLTRLSSTLAKRTGKAAPPYGRCYRGVLDGLIPAEKVGREWQIADADLATAERVLGLAAAPVKLDAAPTIPSVRGRVGAHAPADPQAT